MDFIPKDIEEYCRLQSDAEPEALEELNRETWLKVMFPRMLSGHLQGRFLGFVSKLIRPERILEIGTYTAYGSCCLAEGLTEGGYLDTIEINPELEPIISKYIEKAGYEGRIRVHFGDALSVIPTLNEVYDLMFIDGDKEQYSACLDLLLPKLRPGGLIIADNVLWSGKVLDPNFHHDPETKGILKFNEKVLQTKELEKLMLPFRDGVYLLRKKF